MPDSGAFSPALRSSMTVIMSPPPAVSPPITSPIERTVPSRPQKVPSRPRKTSNPMI
jgi:hypothetical protein